MSCIQPSTRTLAGPNIFEMMGAFCSGRKTTLMFAGFPEIDPPEFLLKNVIESAQAGEDQYCSTGGLPILREKLSIFYKSYFNRCINMDEIIVTAGAQTAITTIFAAFVNPGDEVVFFSPAFPIYGRLVNIFNAIPRGCQLNMHLESMPFDQNEFESLFNSKTKLLILNSPNNPTGKIFTEKEYTQIATFLKNFPNVVVVCDDVYYNIIYDSKKFFPFSSLPGMWERCITVHSWGKIFCATGWRLGCAVGPFNLINACVRMQDILSSCYTRPVMHAWANSIESLNKPYKNHLTYFDFLSAKFQEAKDHLLETLSKTKLNWVAFNPDGGWFVIIDISKIISKIPLKYFYQNNEIKGSYKDYKKGVDNPIEFPPDMALCRYFTIEHNITPLPISYFFYPDYLLSNPEECTHTHIIRWTVCRKMELLNQIRQKLWYESDFTIFTE